MSIKDKPLKKIHSDTRVTIDAIHNNLIDTYKKDLEKLKNSLEREEDVEKQKNIKNEMSKIQESINNYYLDNSLLLSEYYNSNYSNNKVQKKKSIMNFFEKEKPVVEEKDDTDIIVTYLSRIDDNYINHNFKDSENNMYICKECNNENILYKQHESEIYCSKCGYTEKIMINNENIYYKDNPKEISYFAYKRINHFNEWIAQFQAKETTVIPKKVYQSVLDELNKNINIDKKNITHKEVRQILKILKLNKYYEHIPNIINTITGKNAPIISSEYEELLRTMFKEIQEPFFKHCPDNRKNFLSYSYVLYKFCELLELDHLLQYFPLLKSREKLHQQDVIWKCICQELQWEFIPSI